MKSAADKLREELEPIMRDVIRRTPAKIVALQSGLSERQAREHRNDNGPVMGCWDFLAFCMARPELHSALAKAMGFHPLDRQRRQLLDELAKIAMQLPEEGDQEQP